ncbi:MAG: AEC family transporter [Cyanobacteria bacterium P01_E01_bin.45]
MVATLLRLYALLLAVSLCGAIAQRLMSSKMSRYIGPEPLGRFMFWVGVPVSLIGFMRQTDIPPIDLTLPLVVGTTLVVGWGSACLLLAINGDRSWTQERLGSFKLAAMMGNTGYLGYPVCLAVVGNSMFGWALLYDLTGTILGTYGLGVWLASRHGRSRHLSWQRLSLRLLQTPALWGFAFGAALKLVSFPLWLDRSLGGFAWAVVGLSLIIIGMRLAQLRRWNNLPDVAPAIAIKLLALPVAVGLLVQTMPLSPAVRLVLILQAGMPCAFSTLILAEEYRLDRDTSVTAIATSSIAFLLTLPIWLAIWGQEVIG